MKKTCFFVISILFLLSGCHLPDSNVDPGILYTIAAETYQAESNRIASLTPPTETPTATPTATITPTPTMTPTATIQPTPTWVMHAKGSAEALVLFYDEVVKDASDDAYYQWENAEKYVLPIEFEQQVRILYESGYTSIRASDLVKVLREGGELPPRPVVFTFDSTELGIWKNAYPILKKYGFVGNLFIMAGHLEAIRNSLTNDQFKELIDYGWEIGCQGYDGVDMLSDPSKINREIGQCKIKAEEVLGVDINIYAYPGGLLDAGGVMANKVVNYGYTAAFGTSAFGAENAYKHSINNLYYLGRNRIWRGLHYNEFVSILPWPAENISQETMSWTLGTPTLDPTSYQQTVDAGSAAVSADAVGTPTVAGEAVQTTPTVPVAAAQ